MINVCFGSLFLFFNPSQETVPGNMRTLHRLTPTVPVHGEAPNTRSCFVCKQNSSVKLIQKLATARVASTLNITLWPIIKRISFWKLADMYISQSSKYVLFNWCRTCPKNYKKSFVLPPTNAAVNLIIWPPSPENTELGRIWYWPSFDLHNHVMWPVTWYSYS